MKKEIVAGWALIGALFLCPACSEKHSNAPSGGENNQGGEEEDPDPQPDDDATPPFDRLIWAEEFDYTGQPNPENWGYELGYVRNQEKQFYTDDPANARVEGGCLVIEAIRFPENDSITSASLRTLDKVDFMYGRIEARVQIPRNSRGSWPAFWMLGTDRSQFGWPECGELDIMEYVGYYPTKFYCNIHTPGSSVNEQPDYLHKGEIEVTNPYEFHIFAMEWEKTEIRIYMDESLLLTYRKDDRYPSYWRFDKPFFLMVNMAVGGAWGGLHGIDNDAFPYQYKIDWIRYYR